MTKVKMMLEVVAAFSRLGSTAHRESKSRIHLWPLPICRRDFCGSTSDGQISLSKCAGRIDFFSPFSLERLQSGPLITNFSFCIRRHQPEWGDEAYEHSEAVPYL